MGMYDYVKGNIKCPKCGTDFQAKDQIKWTNDCYLNTYSIGDKIDADDGEYTYGSWARANMNSYCPECCTEVRFKAVIQNGVFINIETIGYEDTKYTVEMLAKKPKKE